MCYPKLMSSLILVDPIVFPSYTPVGKHIYAQILGAAARRTHWPNRYAYYWHILVKTNPRIGKLLE